MKIYLLDRRRPITEYWAELFAGEKDVEVVCKDFHDFMNTTEVQCVVSPANSYGLMNPPWQISWNYAERWRTDYETY